MLKTLKTVSKCPVMRPQVTLKLRLPNDKESVNIQLKTNPVISTHTALLFDPVVANFSANGNVSLKIISRSRDGVEMVFALEIVPKLSLMSETFELTTLE